MSLIGCGPALTTPMSVLTCGEHNVAALERWAATAARKPAGVGEHVIVSSRRAGADERVDKRGAMGDLLAATSGPIGADADVKKGAPVQLSDEPTCF